MEILKIHKDLKKIIQMLLATKMEPPTELEGPLMTLLTLSLPLQMLKETKLGNFQTPMGATQIPSLRRT